MGEHDDDNLFDPGEPLANDPRQAQLRQVRRVSEIVARHGDLERLAKPTGRPLPAGFRHLVEAETGMAWKWPDLWLRREGGPDLLIRCHARSEKNAGRPTAPFWWIEPDSWRFLESLDRLARRELPAAVLLTFDESPAITAVELAAVGALEHGLGRGEYKTHSKTSERFAIAPSGRRPLEEVLRG